MLAGDRGLGFAAASTDLVIDVEVTQDRIDDGPCHAAYKTDRLTTIANLEAEDRWPEYRQRAREAGLRAVLAVPMRAWGQTIGVLDIYRQTAGTWSHADRDAAEIMTAMGAGYVLHANQMSAQHELADQLQTALASRDIIGQAKGVLMAQHGIRSDEAFEMLRSTSQANNLKLRDVAGRLVEKASAKT